MTKEERRLWYDCLKKIPVEIKRQRVIGTYIVDFYCASKKLVIEVDGTQHYNGAEQDSDRARDKYLRTFGLTVKRYSNYDINHSFQSVCDELFNYICGNNS